MVLEGYGNIVLQLFHQSVQRLFTGFQLAQDNDSL